MVQSKVLLAATLAFLVTCADAWNSPGHQAVGYIADQLLVGTSTAKEIRKILGTNLKTAAVWADCAKGVSHSNKTGQFSYTVNSRYAECAIFERNGGQALMIDYVSRNWDNCTAAAGAEVCHKQYHYTDVSVAQDAYAMGLPGTSDHDVVHAIKAAIIVLKGGEAPAPIDIASKKEALRLLAHFVGDIHQPLHVTAIYLDDDGNPVDPTLDNASQFSTRGGNSILDHSKKLHAEWDAVAAQLTPDRLTPADISSARQVPLSSGPVEEWSVMWATETLSAGKTAFANIVFTDKTGSSWNVRELPPDYAASRMALQRQQELKAGARLAQILLTLFPPN